MVELVVRLVFSLTVVVGLLLVLARMSAKRFRGSSGAMVQVVHRQALSRGSALSVVTIGSRVLVLGTTEQHVSLITELDPEELVLGPDEGLVLRPDEGLDLTGDGDTDVAAADQAVLGPDAAMVLSPAAGPVLDRPDEPVLSAAQALMAAAAPLRARAVAPGSGKGADDRKAAQRRRAVGAARASDGALAGSLLSAQTWRQAFTAAIGGNDRDVS